jgi:hypothetical protein
MKITGQNSLIGESIENLSRVTIIDNGELIVLLDNYIISTKSNKKIQLIISQSEIEFSPIENVKEAKVVGEYDSIENISTSKTEENLPENIISNIIEVWSGDTNSGFLFQMGFFDNDKFIFAFCFGADEMEVIHNLQKFWEVIAANAKHNQVLLLSSNP